MSPARRKNATRRPSKPAEDQENTVRDGATEDHEGVVDGAEQGPADGGASTRDDDDDQDDRDDDDDDDDD